LPRRSSRCSTTSRAQMGSGRSVTFFWQPVRRRSCRICRRCF
jgi:hypothetical protein